MENDIFEILFSEEEISKRVKELGVEITRDYAGKDLVLVCVLKGASLFMTDLVKRINTFLTIDFLEVSSYEDGTVSSGNIKFLKDLSRSVSGKDVIVVEDILDTGNTLDFISKHLEDKGATSVAIASFLSKPARREKEVSAKYLGFEVPDKFVVGYGLDYNEMYRNLPYIGVLKEELYS